MNKNDKTHFLQIKRRNNANNSNKASRSSQKVISWNYWTFQKYYKFLFTHFKPAVTGRVFSVSLWRHVNQLTPTQTQSLCQRLQSVNASVSIPQHSQKNNERRLRVWRLQSDSPRIIYETFLEVARAQGPWMNVLCSVVAVLWCWQARHLVLALSFSMWGLNRLWLTDFQKKNTNYRTITKGIMKQQWEHRERWWPNTRSVSGGE